MNHAAAIKHYVQYQKFLENNLKKHLIVSSPGVKACLRIEGGDF